MPAANVDVGANQYQSTIDTLDWTSASLSPSECCMRTRDGDGAQPDDQGATPLVWTFLSNAMITSSTEPLQICRLSVAEVCKCEGGTKNI